VRPWLDRMARAVAHASGSTTAFALAAAFVLAWLIGGFWFGWTDPVYALVLNSVTTAITFMMVFAIQFQQDTDTAAIQKKLDTLVVAQPGADDRVAGIEHRARPAQEDRP
jgi:low affinity Fe/Cu permease